MKHFIPHDLLKARIPFPYIYILHSSCFNFLCVQALKTESNHIHSELIFPAYFRLKELVYLFFRSARVTCQLHVLVSKCNALIQSQIDDHQFRIKSFNRRYSLSFLKYQSALEFCKIFRALLIHVFVSSDVLKGSPSRRSFMKVLVCLTFSNISIVSSLIEQVKVIFRNCNTTEPLKKCMFTCESGEQMAHVFSITNSVYILIAHRLKKLKNL